MRWGLIGAGRHVQNQIVSALSGSRTEQIAGLVASTPARSAEVAGQLGIKAYPDIDTLLADDAVDAVYISTPNNQHRAHVEMAARSGKHVIVEKPMALNEADCLAMISACDGAGVSLGLGFQLRHHPVHQRMRRMVEAGELGEPVIVHAEWHVAYAPWRNWRGDPSVAGADVFAAIGVHVLDLMSYLTGREVSGAVSVVDRSAETDLDQTVAWILRFEGGCIGSASVTRRSAAPANSVTIHGTEGTASGIGSVGVATQSRLVRSRPGGPIEEVTVEPRNPYTEQFEAFTLAVSEGRAVTASGLDGLRSVRLTEQILS